ncbi:PREDICTED: daple-like protein isoform X4 [Nicrophorus vespilloides]|uniref:Daple-like protein isoform X4 n=1 Tax=Nicrophorus vespilloides TaxID=110193 RepID=A0ABM1MAU2_NICVS|nr:PREDICTED: daple-like protein isoform X4 [Nicrophorus vespilloides]
MNFTLMSSISPDIKGGYEIIDINAPPIPVDTWNQNIRQELLKATYERLSKTIKLYTKNVTKYAELTQQKKELQEHMIKHMQYFKSQALDLNECTDTEYYELLEDILVTYCKLELDVINRRFKSHKQFVKRNECFLKAAKEKILRAIKTFLNDREKHILHVLLKLKYNTKSEACRRIMSVVYQHVLFTDPKQSFSTEAFCRNYIILMKFMELVPNGDHKHMESLLFKKFHMNASSLMTDKMLNFVLTLKSTSLVELINIKRDVVKRYFKAINKFAYNTVDFTNANSDSIIMDKRVIVITGDSDEDEDCQIGYIEETIKPVDVINLDDDDVTDQPNVPNTPECSTSNTALLNRTHRRRQRPLGDISASELNIGDSDKTKTINVNKSVDTKDNSTQSKTATESLSKENFKLLLDKDVNDMDIKVLESQIQDKLSSKPEDVEVMEVEPSHLKIAMNSKIPEKAFKKPETIIDLIELDDSDDEMDLVETEPKNTQELSKIVDDNVIIDESVSTTDVNKINDVPENNVVTETEVEKELMEVTEPSSREILEEPHTESLHSVIDEDIVMEKEIEVERETIIKLPDENQVQEILHNNDTFTIDETIAEVYSDEAISKETTNTDNQTSENKQFDEENLLETLDNENVTESNTISHENELSNIDSMDIDEETPIEIEAEDTSTNLNEALTSEININNEETVLSESDQICNEKVIQTDDEIINHEFEYNKTPETENISTQVNTDLEDLSSAEFIEDVYQSEGQMLEVCTEDNIEEELQKVLNLGDNIPVTIDENRQEYPEPVPESETQRNLSDNIPVKIDENRQEYPEPVPESVIVMPKEKKVHSVTNIIVTNMQVDPVVEDNGDYRVDENLSANEPLNNNILWNNEPNVQNEISTNKDLSDIIITNVTTLCDKETNKPQVDDVNSVSDEASQLNPKYQYAYGQFTPPFDLSSDTESSSTVVEKESVETQTISAMQKENELLMSEENDVEDESVETITEAPIVQKSSDRKSSLKGKSKRKAKGNSSKPISKMNVLPPRAGYMHKVLASIPASYLTGVESFYDEQFLEKTMDKGVDLPNTANEKVAKTKTKELVDDKTSSKTPPSPSILKTVKKRNSKKASIDMYKEPNDYEAQWNFDTPITQASPSSSTVKKTKAGKKKQQNDEIHDPPKVMLNLSKSNFDLSKVKFQLNAETNETAASQTRKKNIASTAKVEKGPTIYCYGVRQEDLLVFHHKPTIRLEIKSEKQLQFDSCMRKHYTKTSNMKKIELGDCKPSRIPDTEGYLKTHPHPDNTHDAYSASSIAQGDNAKNETIKFHHDDSPRIDKDPNYRKKDNKENEYSGTCYQEIRESTEYPKETYYESAVVSDTLKNYVSNFYPEADDVKEQMIVSTPVPSVSISNITIPAIPVANIPIQNISVPAIPVPNIAVPAVSSSNMPVSKILTTEQAGQSSHLEQISKSAEYMSESEFIDDLKKKYAIESHEVGIFMHHLKETRDLTLPFKKRRLSVTLTEIVPQVKEEISYPATPMISIAEVEAVKADIKRELFIKEGIALVQPANQSVYHANAAVNQYYSSFSPDSIRYIPCSDVYHYNTMMAVPPYPIPNCQEIPANPLPQQQTLYDKSTKNVSRKRKTDSCIY